MIFALSGWTDLMKNGRKGKNPFEGKADFRNAAESSAKDPRRPAGMDAPEVSAAFGRYGHAGRPERSFVFRCDSPCRFPNRPRKSPGCIGRRRIRAPSENLEPGLMPSDCKDAPFIGSVHGYMIFGQGGIPF